MGWFEDLGQDIGSAFGGGETSEQEDIRKKQEAMLKAGLAGAQQKYGEQYYGPTGDDIRRIQELQQVLDNPFGNPDLDQGTRARIQGEIDSLKQKVEGDLRFDPQYMTSTTDYEVQGYNPYRMLAETERNYMGDPSQYQGESAAAGAQADAMGMGAMRDSIGSLRDIYNQGGITAQDRARIEETRTRNQMQEKAARDAIMEDMRRRGIYSGGAELAGRLQNAQSSTNRQAMENLQTEALAEQRKLDAMQRAGELGGQLAEDVYRREFETGSAQDDMDEAYREWLRGGVERDVDTINKGREINAQNQTEANRYLADERNKESVYGADAANRASELNTGWRQEGEAYNTGAAWDAASGVNKGLVDQGNLQMGYAGGFNDIQSKRPTTNWGDVFKRTVNTAGWAGNEIDQATSDEQKKDAFKFTGW